MKFAAVTSKSKDGKEILLRAAVPNDASQLFALKLSYIKGSSTIPMYEDEYKNDEAQEAEMVQRYSDENNSLLIVAEHDGNLIGNLDLTGSPRRKLSHTGMIGMGISNKWQDKGIGHLLLSSALEWAKKASPLTIVWLEVYSTNAAGRTLYRKNGFNDCGIIANFFGEADKITMVKHL